MYYRLVLTNFEKANNDNNKPQYTNVSFPNSFDKDENFVKVSLESAHINSSEEIGAYELRLKNLNPLNQIQGGNNSTFSSSQLGSLSYHHQNSGQGSNKHYYIFYDSQAPTNSYLFFNKLDWNINTVELEFINSETGQVAQNISNFNIVLGFET